jgi:radical SAM protein with 4Fe4S-binding SPASM domain
MLDLSMHCIKGDKWLYELLVEEKQEIFPPNYRLDILYTKDHFNNTQSVGLSLQKMYEYLALIDIPNFFVSIRTNKKDIQQDLSLLKNIFKPTDTDIRVHLIDGEFDKILIHKDSICILPWVHLHINSQGLIGTCCLFDENYPLGNVKFDSIKDVINNDKMKLVRKQMLSNQRPSICNNCWVQENNNTRSFRQESNERYKHYLHLIKETKDDGHFANFKLREIDFRASNICNLKCRMCGGKYSSKIAQEEIVLYPDININKNFIENKLNSDTIQNVLEFITENIDELESIYFAGGEPLVMIEHYKILDLLLAQNKTNISLTYNTNLSILKFKNYKILDYWKKFPNVTVRASIDLIGDRASYVRSGVDYDVIENNYLQIKNQVNVVIDSTLTIYNAFNLMDLQKHWITKFDLSPDVFDIRKSMLPPFIMSCQILPKEYKSLVTEKIYEHVNWLTSIRDSQSLIKKWRDVLQFINAEDRSHLLKDFFKVNDDKDRYRNEVFESVFPEYKNLRMHV